MIIMIIIIIDCLFLNEHQNWELQNQLKSFLQSMLTTSSLKTYSSRKKKTEFLRWLKVIRTVTLHNDLHLTNPIEKLASDYFVLYNDSNPLKT